MKKSFTENEVSGILNYINELYKHEENSFIKIFNKSSRASKMYAIQDLKNKERLENILNKFGKVNTMMSMNPFKTPVNSIKENLFAVNIICVDIDYKSKEYLKNLKTEQVLHLLEIEKFNYAIPSPNIIEYGNQIRLIYILSDTVYLGKGHKARTLIDRVSEFLAQSLVEFGAESQKSEKFLRLPYSINKKGQNEFEVQIKRVSDYELSLEEFKDNWMDDLPEWYEKWKDSRKKTRKKVLKRNNIKTLNINRLKDIKSIQEYLNMNNISDFRKRLIFLYFNYLLIINNGIKDERLLKEVERFNAGFKYPLSQGNLYRYMKGLKSKRYYYKNKTFLQMLEFLGVDLEEFDFKSINSKENRQELNKKYYKKNKEKIKEKSKCNYNLNKELVLAKRKDSYKEVLVKTGKIPKKEVIIQRQEEIRSLLENGFTKQEIILKMNISIKMLNRDIKALDLLA